MDVTRCLSEVSFWTPDHCPKPLSQSLLSPILFWSVEASKPRQIVQVGIEPVDPYIHLCEAVKRLGLGSQCLAVDTAAPGAEAARLNESPHYEWSDHDCDFGSFSKLLRIDADHVVGTFTDRSIDLLLLADSGLIESFERNLDAWAHKLSDRAVLLLPKTGAERGGGGPRRLFQEIARGRASFEFTHGEGLGMVAMGTRLPERLRPLFEAHKVPERRDAIRGVYERLGQSVFNALVNEHGGSAESGGRDEFLTLRRELSLLREEKALLDERHQKLRAEHALLRQENPFLLYHYNHYRHHHDVLLYRLNQLQHSLAWPLLDLGRRLRESCFPESRLHGRCLVLASRFVRVTATVGPLEAGRRVTRRIARKIDAVLKRSKGAARDHAPIYRSIEPTQELERFEDLPWMYTGSRPIEGAAPGLRSRSSWSDIRPVGPERRSVCFDSPRSCPSVRTSNAGSLCDRGAN